MALKNEWWSRVDQSDSSTPNHMHELKEKFTVKKGSLRGSCHHARSLPGKSFAFSCICETTWWKLE